MKAYQLVQQARDVHRLSTLEVIEGLCPDFIELYGDRCAGEDAAMVGGVGRFRSQPITIIGTQKGLDTHENLRRNFGSSGPYGYRKAIRLMQQAEKFNRPILTLINTSGASASYQSEEAGIGPAIAASLQAMSELTVPSVAIILGEGGSGGAIALAVSDQVWMMEHSIYSILSPEGFASILWKDAGLAAQAAEIMKLTPESLYELEVIDRIIPETLDGEVLSKDQQLAALADLLETEFTRLLALDPVDRQQAKFARFRKF